MPGLGPSKTRDFLKKSDRAKNGHVSTVHSWPFGASLGLSWGDGRGRLPSTRLKRHAKIWRVEKPIQNACIFAQENRKILENLIGRTCCVGSRPCYSMTVQGSWPTPRVRASKRTSGRGHNSTVTLSELSYDPARAPH